MTHIEFDMNDLVRTAEELGLPVPKRPGDLVYSANHRSGMPTMPEAPNGMEWVIRGRGKGKYAFELAPITRIKPDMTKLATPITDKSPHIIQDHPSSDDEQALLTIVRNNDLVSTFFGFKCHVLQNHLRSFLKGIGQIEIDEIDLAYDADDNGVIIPIEAKGGMDAQGVVQIENDVIYCQQNYPQMICRPVSIQFVQEADGLRIAISELSASSNREDIKVIREEHYKVQPEIGRFKVVNIETTVRDDGAVLQKTSYTDGTASYLVAQDNGERYGWYCPYIPEIVMRGET